jgi:pyruvate formate lyase activating enzyme
MRSAGELANAVIDRTRCDCFLGGDPSCQIENAVAAAGKVLASHAGRILRICWETNGSVSGEFLSEMIGVSLTSGGCIKFETCGR